MLQVELCKESDDQRTLIFSPQVVPSTLLQSEILDYTAVQIKQKVYTVQLAKLKLGNNKLLERVCA